MLELQIFQHTKGFNILRRLIACCFLIAMLLIFIIKNNIFWSNVGLTFLMCSFFFFVILRIIKNYKWVGSITFNQNDFIVTKGDNSQTFTYFDIQKIDINCYNNYFIDFFAKYSDGYGNYIKIVAPTTIENYFIFVKDLPTFTRIRIHFETVKTTMPYINNWKFKLR